MGSWLLDNAPLAANIASLLMLLVWLFYTLIFYREFRRQRRPLIILHQARGYDLDSTCLLVNLSKEPIHVLCVLMRIRTEHGQYTKRLRDFQQVSPDSELGSRDVQTILKQGPLISGAFLVLGTFREMLDAAGEDAARTTLGTTEDASPGELIPALREIEFQAVALHGAYDRPVGAARTFVVAPRERGVRIQPKSPLTRPMSSSSERRQVGKWLEECFPEPIDGGR